MPTLLFSENDHLHNCQSFSTRSNEAKFFHISFNSLTIEKIQLLEKANDPYSLLYIGERTLQFNINVKKKKLFLGKL